jgi:hypothetical protein
MKWGVLLNLATDHGAGRILQITYFRPSEWPPLKIDGKERSIPETGAATLPGCTQRQQQRSPAIPTVFSKRVRSDSVVRQFAHWLGK